MGIERLTPGTLEWELYRYEHEQRYSFFADRCAGKVVLDAACGVGYGSDILARSGARLVLGVDNSCQAVSQAVRYYSGRKTLFVQMDVENLALGSGGFGAVVSFETIEHLPSHDGFLAGVRRVLTPGGVFICSTHNKDFVPRGNGAVTPNPHHVSEMNYTEFVRKVSGYFEIVEQYHQSHSDSYIRYLDLLYELNELMKALCFSRVFVLSNLARSLSGRPKVIPPPGIQPQLHRAVDGDYVIGPLTEPRDSHVSYILVCRAME